MNGPRASLTSGRRVLLQWQRPTDPNVARVRVLAREGHEGAADWTSLGEFQGDRAVLEGLPALVPTAIALAPVFKNGSVAPEEFWERVTLTPEAAEDDAVLPDAPAGFGAVQSGANVMLAWTANDDLVTVGYEVRLGSWAGGVVIARVSHLTAVAPWWATGTQTYYLRAFDRLGRYSATSATASAIIAALGDYPTASTSDESGGGFTGTKSGTEVNGGNLELATVPTPADTGTHTANTGTWPAWARRYATGTYTTAAIDLGSVVARRWEVTLTTSVQAGASLTASEWVNVPLGLRETGTDAATPRESGQRGFASRRYADLSGMEPVGVLVEIDTAQDGVPTWEGFRRYVPGAYTAQQVRFRLTLTGDGIYYPRVTALQFKYLTYGTAPGAHAATHQHGGGDEVATATAGANAIPKAGGAGTISKDFLPVMVGDGGSGGSKGAVPAPSAGDASKYLRGDATWQTVVGGGGGGQFDYGLVTESPTTNLDWGSVV